MSWSARRPWPLDRDPKAVPPEIKKGDFILSDLIVRPHMKAKIKRHEQPYLPPPICDAWIWQVERGESFMLEPHNPNHATHTVLSFYQVWDGAGEPKTGRHHAPKIKDNPVETTEKEIDLLCL